MSLHIAASQGEIAETVLITGDPLRAKYIAEHSLTNMKCYSEIRGMFGYTGLYKNKRVSVQGTGIGIPSTALYMHELIHEYGVRKIIRIGTCGAIQPNLALQQLIVASQAYTDSNTHLQYFHDMEEASIADHEFLNQARQIEADQHISIVEGAIFSTDTFYSDDADRWDSWRNRGVLAIEMESSILYAMAAKHNVQAISILTVSDNIITGATTTSIDRQEVSEGMIQLALGLV